MIWWPERWSSVANAADRQDKCSQTSRRSKSSFFSNLHALQLALASVR